MGDVVVKAARDVDLYLVWSTEFGSVVWVGDREGVLSYLWREFRRRNPDADIPAAGAAPEDRVARADLDGTSALGAWAFGGWGDAGWEVRGGVPDPDRDWALPRRNLVAYAESVLAGEPGEDRWPLLEEQDG